VSAASTISTSEKLVACNVQTTSVKGCSPVCESSLWSLVFWLVWENKQALKYALKVFPNCKSSETFYNMTRV